MDKEDIRINLVMNILIFFLSVIIGLSINNVDCSNSIICSMVKNPFVILISIFTGISGVCCLCFGYLYKTLPKQEIV